MAFTASMSCSSCSSDVGATRFKLLERLLACCEIRLRPVARLFQVHHFSVRRRQHGPKFVGHLLRDPEDLIERVLCSVWNLDVASKIFVDVRHLWNLDDLFHNFNNDVGHVADRFLFEQSWTPRAPTSCATTLGTACGLPRAIPCATPSSPPFASCSASWE